MGNGSKRACLAVGLDKRWESRGDGTSVGVESPGSSMSDVENSLIPR